MEEKIGKLALVGFFAALASLLAYIAIPLPGGLPPVTGQTFAAMLAGLLLGSKSGALSLAVYILLGICGLPVFAGGTAGAGVLAGPTGGFILGFIPAVYVTGRIAEKKRRPSLASYFGAAVIGGIIVLYLPATVQLARVLSLPAGEALILVLPYLPGDLGKAFFAALLAVKIRQALAAGRRIDN